MDFRPILYATGVLLCILAIGMVVPMMADLLHGNEDWEVFFICISTTAFFGGCLVLTNAGSTSLSLNIRQAFVLTTLIWVAMATFGSLPIWLSHEDIDFTDAFFESMSLITTTGSTVLTGIDTMPPGTLLWRSILSWIGGIGFILMAILILPFLKVGGMQLFRTESSDKSEKALPRLKRIGTLTGITYALLTFFCALSYWVAGMSGFDSINHAMSTLATAGTSTHDNSFGFYQNPMIHVISTIFMTLGALPFVLYIRGLNGDIAGIFRNSQVRAFLIFLTMTIAVMSMWLTFKGILPAAQAVVHSAFNIVSIVTTTGYASADYMQWGALPITMFFVLTFVGGCTGSTSGGIKIMRFQIMAEILSRHLKKLTQPNTVLPLRYEGRTIGDDIAYSVMVFIFTHMVCIAALSVALGFCGLDFVTSITGAATALSNVGPGLGDIIGPAGNFSTLPDAAKWLLSSGMLLGRLEMFTVLVLLTPYFWRR